MRLKDFSILNPAYQGDTLEKKVSFVPMESLRNGKIDYQEIPFPEAKGKYTFFANGDLLIAKVTPCFENGNIAIANDMQESIGFGSSEIFVLRLDKSVLNTYMFYVVQTSKFQDSACATMCGVGGLKRISPLFMRTYELNVPALFNQHKIVDYLDNKTSAIDTKIELLEKKKSEYTRLKKAIINHAVTRGLDEHVKLKVSGMEWIGMIPEHWKVKRIKDFSELRSGDNLTSIEISEEGEFPVYGGNGIRGYYHNYSNDGYYVLIGRQGALCGNIHIVNGKFWATDHAVVCYPKVKFNARWFAELLKAMNLGQYSFAAAQPGLSVERIKNLKIIVPPHDEQQTIAAYLDEKCSKIDAIIANIDKQTGTLKRLKRSLINEVITGQRAV